MARIVGEEHEGAASVHIVEAHAVVCAQVVVVPIEILALRGVRLRQVVQFANRIAWVLVVGVVAKLPDVLIRGKRAVGHGQRIFALVVCPEGGAHVVAILGVDADARTILHEVELRGFALGLQHLHARALHLHVLARAGVLDGIENGVAHLRGQDDGLLEARVFPIEAVGGHASVARGLFCAAARFSAARCGVAADALALLVIDVEVLVGRVANIVGAHQSRAVGAHIEADAAVAHAGNIDGAVGVLVEIPFAVVVRHARGQLQTLGCIFALVVRQSLVLIDDVLLRHGILDGVAVASALGLGDDPVTVRAE